MNDGVPVRLRCLPEGVECEALISSMQGRVLELDVQTPATELIPAALVEIRAEDTIYLGAVQRRQNQRLWVEVEHLLDRKTLASIQAAWKE
jgi:hypothetical protein